MKNNDLLRIADLKVIEDEPRIQDLRVAERLGFANPLMIRKLIERNWVELESHGVISTVEITTTAKGGRPGKEYWLIEGQILVVAALSRTPAAAALRKEVIDVYMAYRRGQLEQQTTSNPTPTPRIQDIDQVLGIPVRQVTVRPNGQWGPIWAIPVYNIAGLDYWNVHLVVEAYSGLRYVPDTARLNENARDLREIYPKFSGYGPLWVAREDGLTAIIQRVGGCWDDRARRFINELTERVSTAEITVRGPVCA